LRREKTVENSYILSEIQVLMMVGMKIMSFQMYTLSLPKRQWSYLILTLWSCSFMSVI